MVWGDAKPPTPILSPKAHVIGCSNLKPLLSAKSDSGANRDEEPRRQLETEEPSSILRFDDARPLVPRGLEHCAKAFRRKVLITRSTTRRTMKTSTSNTDGLLNGRRCGTLSSGKTLTTINSDGRQTLWNPVLGEDLEDLDDDHDHEKLECQQSARRTALLYSVLGENHELAAYHDHVELECRRSARRPNPVQRENLDDQNLVLHHRELESRRAAPLHAFEPCP